MDEWTKCLYRCLCLNQANNSSWSSEVCVQPGHWPCLGSISVTFDSIPPPMVWECWDSLVAWYLGPASKGSFSQRDPVSAVDWQNSILRVGLATQRLSMCWDDSWTLGSKSRSFGRKCWWIKVHSEVLAVVSGGWLAASQRWHSFGTGWEILASVIPNTDGPAFLFGPQRRDHLPKRQLSGKVEQAAGAALLRSTMRWTWQFPSLHWASLCYLRFNAGVTLVPTFWGC